MYIIHIMSYVFTSMMSYVHVPICGMCGMSSSRAMAAGRRWAACGCASLSVLRRVCCHVTRGPSTPFKAPLKRPIILHAHVYIYMAVSILF